MGIPRLTSYLSPYAKPTILGCQKKDCPMHSFSIDCSRSRVILDGPAFAYTIYGRLIAGKADYLGPLAAVPSYDEVGKAALAFLGELEKCGVVMYDSATEKRPTFQWSIMLLIQYLIK